MVQDRLLSGKDVKKLKADLKIHFPDLSDAEVDK